MPYGLYNDDGGFRVTVVDEDESPYGIYSTDGSLRVTQDVGRGLYAPNGAIRVAYEDSAGAYTFTGALNGDLDTTNSIFYPITLGTGGRWWKAPKHVLDGVAPLAVLSPASGRFMLNGRAVNDNALISRQGGVKYVIGKDGTLQQVAANVLAYDYASGHWRLRFEGQATNLLLGSGAPVTQSLVTSAAVYTLSFWGTGTVNLSGTASASKTGAGAAVRSALTFTAAAGTLTLTVSGAVINAQMEAGPVASSYVPTSSAAVTRPADVTRLWAGAGEATAWAWRGNVPAAIANQQFLGSSGGSYIRDGSTTDQVMLAGISTALIAGNGILPGYLAFCGGWGASGRRASVAASAAVSDAVVPDRSRTAMSVGAIAGLVAGQILDLDELVAWKLPDRPSAAGCQGQARAWSA